MSGDPRLILQKVQSYDGYEHLPEQVAPDALPDLVEAEAPRQERSYPGRGSYVAEILVRETYGLPAPGKPQADPWWSRRWVDRARDLVRDGWARLRDLARQALEVPKPEPLPEPLHDPMREAAERLNAMTDEDWEILAPKAKLKPLPSDGLPTVADIERNAAKRSEQPKTPTKSPEEPGRGI